MKLRSRTLVPLASLALSACLVGGVAMAAVPHIRVGKPVCHPMKAVPETSGLYELIGEALSEVDLRPDQKTAVQKLGDAVRPKQAAVDLARTDLLRALIDGLEKANFDRKALEPKIDAFVAAREAEAPVLRKGLVALHQTLDPKQRAKFVDALEKRLHEAAEGFKSGKQLAALAKELSLSDAQRSALHTRIEQLAKRAEPELQKGKEMLEAFRGNTFDPDAIVPERDVHARAKAHADKMVDMTEAFSGILTPEQRAKAASKLRTKLGGC